MNPLKERVREKKEEKLFHVYSHIIVIIKQSYINRKKNGFHVYLVTFTSKNMPNLHFNFMLFIILKPSKIASYLRFLNYIY